MTAILGDGNFVGDKSGKVQIIGDKNKVQGKKGIILGDGNRVSEGVENFFLLGATNKEITESNTGYIGDVFYKNGKVDSEAFEMVLEAFVAKKNANELIPDQVYFITDRQLYIRAITENEIARDGYTVIKCVKNVYFASIDIYDYNEDYVADDLVIYANRVWKCLTSAPAQPIDFNNLSTDFELIEDTYYENKTLQCKFFGDYTLSQVSDNRGNIVTNNTFGGFLYSDWNANQMQNNICWGFMSNTGSVKNNNCKLIANNTLRIAGNGTRAQILDNRNNGHIVKNDSSLNIFSNVNNGNIGSLTSNTVRTSEVFDTIVNK